MGAAVAVQIATVRARARRRERCMIRVFLNRGRYIMKTGFRSETSGGWVGKRRLCVGATSLKGKKRVYINNLDPALKRSITSSLIHIPTSSVSVFDWNRS